MKKSEYLDRWAGRIFNLLLILLTGLGVVVMATLKEPKKVYFGILMFLSIFILIFIVTLFILYQNINDKIENDE